MKIIFFLLLTALTAPAAADTIILKDGTRLEGVVEGELDGASLIRTKYGSLTVKKEDIQEILPEKKPAEPAPVAPAEVAASTETAAAVSTAPPAAVAEAVTEQPSMTFTTIRLGTSAVQKVYSEDGVAIATQTWSPSGELLSSEGTLRDGAWKELYPDGKVKTEKAVLGGRDNGPLRTFYPSGALQTEANYLAGRLDGPMITYTEDATPLFEQNFVNGKLHGLVREFNPDSSVKSETLYADGSPVASQSPTPAPAMMSVQETKQAKEPDSMVTSKIALLARGERISFYLNNRYTGKIQFDRDFNVINYHAKIPDGTVKAYSIGGKFSRNYGVTAPGTETFDWDGRLARELVFEGNQLKILRVFAFDGTIEHEFTFKDGKAIKK
jgi:antitoxin component YwqK of YwqJK toxin-antitoxin module